MTNSHLSKQLDDQANLPDKKRPISRKVREAIDAMVWEGLPRDKAAAKAGISDHGLYKALRSPPVKAHYLSECEVLRTSGRARRIHRLEAMVEQNDNKAAVVNAALALERMSPDEQQSRTAQSSPGMVIVINNSGSGEFKSVDVERQRAISTTYERNDVHDV